MPNLEEAIRERAYHLWIADGQPEGKADVYWLSAQREILTTSLEGSSETAAIPHMDFSIGHDQACQKGEGRPIGKRRIPRCIVSPWYRW